MLQPFRYSPYKSSYVRVLSDLAVNPRYESSHAYILGATAHSIYLIVTTIIVVSTLCNCRSCRHLLQMVDKKKVLRRSKHSIVCNWHIHEVVSLIFPPCIQPCSSSALPYIYKKMISVYYQSCYCAVFPTVYSQFSNTNLAPNNWLCTGSRTCEVSATKSTIGMFKNQCLQYFLLRFCYVFEQLFCSYTKR